eukprot:gene104-4353_t
MHSKEKEQKTQKKKIKTKGSIKPNVIETPKSIKKNYKKKPAKKSTEKPKESTKKSIEKLIEKPKESTKESTKKPKKSTKNKIKKDEMMVEEIEFKSTLDVDASQTKFSNEEIDQFIKQYHITVSDKKEVNPMLTFASGNFPQFIMDELSNFKFPTPIQSISWPIILAKKNIVSIAKTGSGKSLAFIIPAILHIKSQQVENRNGPIVLVMTPTRELAQQIALVFKQFSNGIDVDCIYGGRKNNEKKRLNDTEILVATPGRLEELIRFGKISMESVSYFTLDEADIMLDMGFAREIKKIVAKIPEERQTLMFSATWKPEVQKIAEDFCPKSVKVNIGKFDISANENIEQKFLSYKEASDHYQQLLTILKDLNEKKSKALIFCDSKNRAGKLNKKLQKEGFKTAEIHSDIKQNKRDAALFDFKNNKIHFLVATDIASRGIDVTDINTVINYEFPREDIESYVHRIGRTARAGKSGIAISFLGDSEDYDMMMELKKILDKDNLKIPDCLQYYLDLTPEQVSDHKKSQELDKLERKERYMETVRNTRRKKLNAKYGNKKW